MHTEVAERVLYQNQVLAAEAAAQRQFLEQALQMQDQLAYQQHLTWLTKVEADKAALNSELSKLVRAAELEKEAARLQIRRLELELEEAVVDHNEAVKAAARAMTLPELQGEEYQVLQELLKAEH